MHGALKIFFSDIRSVACHFFALAIVGGVLILPALYAWINIYANGDPYKNTSRIPVAVSSRDEGITLSNGRHINKAKKEIERLKNDTSCGWIYVEDPKKAIRGVRSGKYYAAVVFEEGFTGCMRHSDRSFGGRPAGITYYSNTKKNAIAAKITDAAVSALCDRINGRYVRSLLLPYVRDVTDFSLESDVSEIADRVIGELKQARATLREYRTLIASLTATAASARGSLDRGRERIGEVRSNAKTKVEQAKDQIRDAQTYAEEYRSNLKDQIEELEAAIRDMEESIEEWKAQADTLAAGQLRMEAMASADRLNGILQQLRASLPENPRTQGAALVKDAIERMLAKSREIRGILQIAEDYEDVPEGLWDRTESLKTFYEEDLNEAFDRIISDTNTWIERIDPVLTSVDETAAAIEPVLSSAQTAAEKVDTALGQLSVVLASADGELNRAIDKLRDAESGHAFTNPLKGKNPGRYTRFFSSPIRIRSRILYPVANYGTAMTPFYSVLGLWVGAVVLTSLLNTHVDRRKHPGFSEASYFFGRYLIFALLGQLQAAIIVGGDILLLHCEPVCPGLMFLAAGITSLVFSLLIYAIVLSFGDLGKGAVVVVMVLQIAGTGGSFPVEILPPSFRAIYRFFPFSYAINAMREAICGTYGIAYGVDLARLGVFAVVALAIGLLVRKPFMGVNDFLAKRLEETEVL